MIFFLPWILLSGAFLVAWVLHRRVSYRRSRVRVSGSAAKGLLIIGLSLLLAAPPSLAAPATEEHEDCPVSVQQAHLIGDRLFEQSNYQAAGECYLAAGDYDRANRAFMKAVVPAGAATASQLSGQKKQVKTMLRKLQDAFRSQH